MTDGMVLGVGLEELLDRTATAVENYRSARRTAIESALEAGKCLTEAKGRLNHGDWLPWIGRVGITPRTAQRWMALFALNLDAVTIAEAGGMSAVLNLSDNPETATLQRRALELTSKLRLVNADNEARYAAATPEGRAEYDAYAAKIDAQFEEIATLRAELDRLMVAINEKEAQADALQRQLDARRN